MAQAIVRSQNAEGACPGRPKRDFEVGIFLVGLVCLMLELLHTRMLAFFLGSISNFLAIPVALFGIALGALLVQRKEKGDARHLIAILQALVLPVLTAAFVGFFVVANAFFPPIHVSLENPYGDAARMLTYSAIFLPPYAVLSYMCVEIGLMAKSELFLGNPPHAVAVILALFLASNGLGAYLQDRLRVFRGLATLVPPAIAAIAWGVLASHLCNARLLSLPLPLKILCVALSVVPAGTFLGMFYPFGVERVVEAGRRAAVPATYATATLSSVWGSSWAMTAIANLGFSAVILMGAAGYALTGVLYLVARRLRA